MIHKSKRKTDFFCFFCRVHGECLSPQNEHKNEVADIQHVYHVFFQCFRHYVRRYREKRRTCPDVRRLFIYTGITTQH